LHNDSVNVLKEVKMDDYVEELLSQWDEQQDTDWCDDAEEM